MEEFEFMLDFIKEADFGFDVCQEQLRCLWTAYCLRNAQYPDTYEYDNDIRDLYKAVNQNTTNCWVDGNEYNIDGFEEFDKFMCQFLI